MSSAQLERHSLDEPGVPPEAAAPFPSPVAPPFLLREQVAERLAAHRARRAPRPASPVATVPVPDTPKTRSARIAAAVAERYAQSQSYRAFLAAEAERAIQQAEAAVQHAEAAAEVAAISARAVADAQYKLLDNLDKLDAGLAEWAPAPSPPTSPALAEASQSHRFDALSESPLAAIPAAAQRREPLEPSWSVNPQSAVHVSGGTPAFVLSPPAPHPASAVTVRLYEEVSRSPASTTKAALRLQPRQPAGHAEGLAARTFTTDEAEGLALDEEIAFRQSPVFDEFAISPTEIPANLIEFPRQLVASRKARPRLAEGPLREDADHAPATAQLRIFEVEATQISSTPPLPSAEYATAVEPVWSSILLGARPSTLHIESTEPVFNPALPPQTARLSLRLMAGLVDGCLLLAAFLAFTAASALTIAKLAGTQVPFPLAAPFAGPPAGSLAGGLASPLTQMSLQTAALATIAVLGFLTLLYHLLFFTFAEATPGMRYARIGLCTLSDENPTRTAMRRRLFAMILSAIPLGFGFLWACLDEDRLGWHDRISRMYQRSY